MVEKDFIKDELMAMFKDPGCRNKKYTFNDIRRFSSRRDGWKIDLVRDALNELEEEGFEITYIEPQPKTGLITPEMVEAAIRPDTILVSLMMVNNEIAYHVESTPSRPIWQVKQRWAWLVLGSETAWESQVS